MALTKDRPLLELQGVDAGYARSEPTLRGVSLTVGPGELWTVCGPNGSGKSTLVRLLSGALAARRGEILLRGRPMAGLSRREVARAVAVVHQQSEVAFGFTVGEVVRMGRAPHQDGFFVGSAEDERIVAREIERCALGGLEDKPVASLSGGEKKRVALARALAQSPAILLLDEPAAFLDVHHEARFFSLVSGLVRDEKLACLAVLHDFGAARDLATHALLLSNGEVRAQGRPEDVLTRERLEALFDVTLIEAPRLVVKP